MRCVLARDRGLGPRNARTMLVLSIGNCRKVLESSSKEEEITGNVRRKRMRAAQFLIMIKLTISFHSVLGSLRLLESEVHVVHLCECAAGKCRGQ
jgi:hypothetical protein